MSSSNLREALEKDPKYRKDEKDGRFYPYEFYPGGDLYSGLLFQSGEYTILFIPHTVSDKTETYEENNIEWIERVNPEEIDRRDEVFWINHHDKDHIIRIVIDQESDNKGNGKVLSPHLNWKGENDEDPKHDMYIHCEKCRNYFKFIEHIEVEFDIADEDTKIINWKETISKFKREITNSDFYEENEVAEFQEI